MAVYNNVLAGAAGQGGGFEIEHSLRFNPGDSPQLKRDFTEAGNRRTWTFSCWVKRTTSFNSYRHTIASGPGTTLSFSESAQGGSDSFFFYVDGTPYLLSDEVARDTAAWYHVVFVFDTTNATAADRCRIYKNGVRITNFRNTAYPAQNFEGNFNTAGTHKIGYGNANEVLDGYLADVHFVDGQALDPTSFGEFDDDTGVWNPIRYSGTYGTNGFKLVFDPTAGFGDDTNGGYTTLVTTSNITAVSTSSVSLGGSSTGNNSTSQSEVNNAFDNNTSTFFGFGSGGSSPAQIKEWTFSTGLPVKAGDVVSYEGGKGAGFKAGVFLANGQVVGGNYPYPNVDSVTASSDTTITKINAGSFGGGNQYSNIKKLTINGVAYPLSATELTLTDTTGLSNLSTGHEIIQTGGTATGTIYRISGTTVDLTQTTNTWSTGSTANKPSLPITNDFTPTNLTTSVQSVQTSPITAVATVNTWNQDKVWSNEVSGPRQGSNPWSNAFNGNINSNVDVAGSTSLNQSFTGVTSFRFATVINQPVTISGTGITTQTWSTAGWKTVTLTSTSISNIVVSPGPGETMTYPSAFEVNGEILVDQGVSGNQVISNTLTLTDTTNLSSLSVGDVVYPPNKQITAINTSTPSIVVNGGAFQVGGVVSKLGTFGDDVIDTPTNAEQLTGNAIGNYATLNPLNILKESGTTTSALSNGGLDVLFQSGTNAGNQHHSTIGVSSGKYYIEWTDNSSSPSSNSQGFIAGVMDTANQGNFLSQAGGYAISTGSVRQLWLNGSSTNTWWSGTPTQGDIYALALDCDNSTISFYRNGVSLGATQSIPAGKTYVFAVTPYQWQATPSISMNFGQRGSFDFAVPTGFKALCTENLNDPLIEDPSPAFDAKVWAGNGSSQSITGLLKPDLVWIKQRSTEEHHVLFDTLRGATKQLYSNLTNAETTQSTTLTAFNSDGFTVGSDDKVNENGQSHVGWVWNSGDLVTNSAYNQSEVWSTGMSGTPYTNVNTDGSFDKMFNDDDSSYVWARNSNLTFTLPSSISGVISVRCKNGNTSSTSTVTLSDNQSQTTTSGTEAFQTLTFNSATNITSMTFAPSGTGLLLYEILLDGKVLVDTGIIPPGSLNSSVYDQSDTWTDDFSGPSGSLSYVGDMFDGNLGTEVYASTHPATITWTPSGGLAYTSMRINARTQAAHSNGVKYKLVGGSEVSIGNTTTATWYTLPANSTLEYIKIERPSGSNAAGLVAAVEKDGKLLVNDTTTPANVPSIASTVRANPTAGFSIVSYIGNYTPGATVGHGLNTKTEFILFKNRTDVHGWGAYHSGIGATQRLRLSSNEAAAATGLFENTEPTSSVFTIGDTNTTNGNGDDMIAYCFAPVEGYSKFGTYTGNGNADGPFVFTGFRPALIILKMTDGTGFWKIYDSARDPDNAIDSQLYPNANYAEAAGDRMDFLSNGFKIRTAGSEDNGSGNNYIYYAVAENPFKTARAR